MTKAANPIVRTLAIILFIAVVMVSAGCQHQSNSEIKPPLEKTLLLEHLATILDYAWAWGSEAKVAFNGSIMFVPNGFRGISLYNLSDPRNPVHLVRVDPSVLGGQGGAVAVLGQRAFVATPDSDMIVELDVSTPSSPVIVSRFGGIPEYDQLVLCGHYLFVQSGSCVDYKGGAYVFDILQSPPSLAGMYLADLIDPGFYVTASGRVF